MLKKWIRIMTGKKIERQVERKVEGPKRKVIQIM